MTTIANEWRWLALAWHLVVAVPAVLVLTGRRPSKWLVALLCTSPVLSVSALAWAAGNPFNGTLFAVLAAVLARLALRLPRDPVAFGSRPLVVLGTLLVGFGWTYPHFLEASAWTSYLYEAPLGLVPCPTLSLLVGVSLILRSFDSATWATTVAFAALVYGVIGVFVLGVAIDVVLLAGGVVLGACAALSAPRLRAGRPAV